MKIIAFSIFSFLYTCSLASQGKPYVITCYFPNSSTQSDISMVVKRVEDNPLIYKAAIVNKYAVFSFELDEPAPAYLWMEDYYKDEIHFFLDSTSLEFTIYQEEALRYEISGSRSTARWNEIRTNHLMRTINVDSLWENFHSKQTGDSIAIRVAWNVFRDSISTQEHKYFLNTIRSNPTEEFSWYLYKSSVNGLSRKEASMLLSRLGFFSDRPKYMETADKLNKVKVGAVLPKNHFTTHSGKRVDLQHLNSGLVLIDFCSVYYSESQKFHRSLKDLYARYNRSGLEIISVCLEFDPNPDPENLKSENLPWFVAFAHGGEKERVEKDFGITIFPDNVLVDSKNKVVLRNASFAEIEKLLSEKYK